jgi:NAD(P)-dependent dehydrogenase (short-subunit alcohol dehydrogenase family)
MGLTENTPAALLALHGLDVRPNSAVSLEDTEVGLTGSDQNAPVLALSKSRVLSGFEGESSAGDPTLGRIAFANLDALGGLLPWLQSSSVHARLRASATGWASPPWPHHGPAGSQRGPTVLQRSCGKDVRRRTVEQGSMNDLFSLAGKVAVVTGATGVLGSEMARSLAESGARVAVLGRREEKAHRVARELEVAGGESLALLADVLDTDQLQEARDALLERWGRVDILVNAAGGNVPEATLSDGVGIFQLPEKALRRVMDLNFLGTLLPCQIFGAAMVEGAEEPDGCIVNISSMAAAKTLTDVVGYSAAKAAVDNFTRWLAVELARSYGPGLRVNAIAPGFFIGEQNRDLLLDEDGNPSKRGQDIIEHTPAGRFGEPDELGGTLIWLCSPASAFVNGIVVPVDGGFSAFSGV